MKRIVSIALSLLLALGLVGCGGSSASGGSYSGGSYSGGSYSKAESGYASAPMENAAYESGWDGELAAEPEAPVQEGSSVPSSVKMVYTADISLETLTFDQAVEDIGALVTSYGGYYEGRTISGYDTNYRSARFTVRVPADAFDSFCGQVGNICHVLRINTSAENISQVYYDTDTRLTTAKTKLARLQALLERAENMEDIITIESAIADTQQDIDTLSGALRKYDALVDYATVSIHLQEVYKLAGTNEPPTTLASRISRSFQEGLESVVEFLEDLAVWLAYSWIWLLVCVVILILVIRLIRRLVRGSRKTTKRRKKDRKSAVPQEQNNSENPTDET